MTAEDKITAYVDQANRARSRLIAEVSRCPIWNARHEDPMGRGYVGELLARDAADLTATVQRALASYIEALGELKVAVREGLREIDK